MSTVAHAIAAPTLPLPQFAPKFPHSHPPRRKLGETRRTSPVQGRALEILGHAIEYLVDSRLYETWETPADAAAVHLLMVCSREVFSECDVVVSWHQRVQRSLLRRLHMEPQTIR